MTEMSQHKPMTEMEWLLHLKNVGERFGYKNVLEYVDFHMKRMTIETAMKEHQTRRYKSSF